MYDVTWNLNHTRHCKSDHLTAKQKTRKQKAEFEFEKRTLESGKRQWVSFRNLRVTFVCYVSCVSERDSLRNPRQNEGVSLHWRTRNPCRSSRYSIRNEDEAMKRKQTELLVFVRFWLPFKSWMWIFY